MTPRPFARARSARRESGIDPRGRKRGDGVNKYSRVRRVAEAALSYLAKPLSVVALMPISKLSPSYVVDSTGDLSLDLATTDGSDVVLLSAEEIEQQLAKLGNAMPGLLKDNQGAEFWAAFTQRANALKERVSLDHFDWVTERIHAILAAYGISPPSRWIIDALAKTHGAASARPE